MITCKRLRCCTRGSFTTGTLATRYKDG